MKKIQSVIKIKANFRTHIPKPLLEAIGAEEGDFIKISLWKEDEDEDSEEESET
jgi:bifunctional DNA-binding transcriptional regulator/antitoxin component of YhaV-PrlF toxin-antitoxin module